MNDPTISRSDAGYTLLEVIVVLTITTFLVVVMSTLVSTTGESQHYTERMARIMEVNQEIINEQRGELLSTVTLFQKGTMGDGYFNAIQKGSAPPIAGSLLPATIVNGNFGTETTSGERTGNVLLFAAQAWTTGFQCTSGKTYFLDVYRLTSYYLTAEDSGPNPDTGIGLNLTKLVSEPLVDGNELDNVSDATDQAELLMHVRSGSADIWGNSHDQVKLVWRRGREITETDAMREIDGASFLMSSTPITPRPAGAWQIMQDERRSARGLLHYRHFSVASNWAHQRVGVARFGVKNNTGDGFPHGFEVQVAGPSSTRQVLLHLSILSTNNKGTKAHSDLRATVLVQDI